MEYIKDFAGLASIDVSQYVEKKGKFSYLSWAWAVDQLMRNDPTATWEVLRFDGLPYLKTELGFFVEVAVTSNGVTKSQLHPVLDNRNKPMDKPSTFDINTSIQRCLVKAIALHGLGLYIYAGEDLPVDVKSPEPITAEQIGEIKTRVLKLSELRDVESAKYYEALGVTNLESLTGNDAVTILDKLDKWMEQAKEK